MTETNDLLRPEEVAQRLQISKSRAYQLLATREIPVVRVGRLVRVERADLDAFIARQREEGAYR